MLKIVVMPVKNEAWILESSLAAASLWADHIIVADQLSEDSTPEICKKFPKVEYVLNRSNSFNEGNRRQLLLDNARSFEGKNLICALDADEIVSAPILESSVLDNLLKKVQPGMSVEMELVNLWNNPTRYCSGNSIWSGRYMNFFYWDDRQMKFGDGTIHLSRVPEVCQKQSVRFEELKVMHYQFVSQSRMLAKQRRYRVMERILYPEKSTVAINHRYFASKNTVRPKVNSIPHAWISQYQDQGVNLTNFIDEDLYWYEIEVLRFFKKYGSHCFSTLDIWDVDWEKKRQLALKVEGSDVPDQPIIDSRGLPTKFYHRFLQSPLEQIFAVRNFFKEIR